MQKFEVSGVIFTAFMLSLKMRLYRLSWFVKSVLKIAFWLCFKILVYTKIWKQFNSLIHGGGLLMTFSNFFSV